MLTNTRARYGFVAQILHWITAALILFLIPLGVYMHELPQGSDAEISQKIFLYSLHKSIGIVLLSVAVLRVLWALFNKKPAPLHAERKLETFVAETIHWLLYGSLIAVPVSGWLHHAATDGFAPIWWFENQNLPFVPTNAHLAELFASMHFFFAVTLVLSLVLHIVGAMKHAVMDKDATLARMIPGKPADVSTVDTDITHSKSPLFLAAIVLLGALGVGYGAVHFSAHDETAAASLQQATGEWAVRATESSLDIGITQNGAPVAGSFANWAADITFDPDNLDAAKVHAEIDVTSLTLGSVTSQALSSDFLNTGEHPKAVFTSNVVTRNGDSSYTMSGSLELSGVTSEAIVDFTLTIENGVATMSGAAVLNRMDFGVGATGFPNESSVAFPVEVQIEIVADQVN